AQAHIAHRNSRSQVYCFMARLLLSCAFAALVVRRGHAEPDPTSPSSKSASSPSSFSSAFATDIAATAGKTDYGPLRSVGFATGGAAHEARPARSSSIPAQPLRESLASVIRLCKWRC